MSVIRATERLASAQMRESSVKEIAQKAKLDSFAISDAAVDAIRHQNLFLGVTLKEA
jgi:hypothetical protein